MLLPTSFGPLPYGDSPPQLGGITDDLLTSEIAQKARDVARVLFPEDTARIEAYVTGQVKQAVQQNLVGQAGAAFSNPIVWVLLGGMGLILLGAITRR